MLLLHEQWNGTIIFPLEVEAIFIPSSLTLCSHFVEAALKWILTSRVNKAHVLQSLTDNVFCSLGLYMLSPKREDAKHLITATLMFKLWVEKDRRSQGYQLFMLHNVPVPLITLTFISWIIKKVVFLTVVSYSTAEWNPGAAPIRSTSKHKDITHIIKLRVCVVDDS